MLLAKFGMQHLRRCGLKRNAQLCHLVKSICFNRVPMLNYFREDLRQYFGSDKSFRSIAYACFEMGIWAIAVFRFGKWVQRIRFSLFRWPLIILYFFLYKFMEAISGIRISSESEIGPGLVIHNFGGVIIKGTIGKNCVVVQGAQIISRADGHGRGWPTLGDNVYVGSGAKILGNVKIGSNSRIGANAVVMKDVPENSLVMPPECKVIRGFYRFKQKEAAIPENTHGPS
jgi:serine O-acetyltransferase